MAQCESVLCGALVWRSDKRVKELHLAEGVHYRRPSPACTWTGGFDWRYLSSSPPQTASCITEARYRRAGSLILNFNINKALLCLNQIISDLPCMVQCRRLGSLPYASVLLTKQLNLSSLRVGSKK